MKIVLTREWLLCFSISKAFMNPRQKLCLSISICALSSSALAGSFERPAPLIPSPNNEEVFQMFHFFMPENGLPPHQKTIPPLLPGTPAIFPLEFRTIDGTNDNLSDPTLGSANTPFLRTTTNAYGDGLNTPAGAGQRGTRDISNLVDAQAASVPIALPESSFWWGWGQFIDHDMTLTPIAVPTETFNIPVPACDPVFDPNCTGTATLPFSRSTFINDENGVRQQLNANTHWIDASMVYGSDDARAQELRALDGTGHLKVGTVGTNDNMLPFNVNRFPNEPNILPTFFLAGDVRANENPVLTALQTLFMREHNFWADHFKSIDRTLDDDGLYFRARAIVGAEIQKITYTDFLPFLIGKDALTPYTGYNETVDPSIANVFAAAAWRFGHSLLNATISLVDANNQSISNPRLQTTFFAPAQISNNGIEPYLRGLARQKAEEIDGLVVDGVRNFAPPHGGGFDLVALNVQRGRDHGLPRFNQVRLDYGLPAYTSFSQLTTDTTMQAKLASAYNTVDDVDAYLGLLIETHQSNALVGPTLITILKEQFQRLRDGDRFWYEAYLDPATLSVVQHTKLSDIILRNCPTITTTLQPNVFALPTPTPPPSPTPRPTRTPRPSPTPTPTPTPTP
jgi:peroxidase